MIDNIDEYFYWCDCEHFGKEKGYSSICNVGVECWYENFRNEDVQVKTNKNLD